MKLKNTIKYCCFVLAVFICVPNTKVNASPLTLEAFRIVFEECGLDPQCHYDLDLAAKAFIPILQSSYDTKRLVKQFNIVREYFSFPNEDRREFIEDTLEEDDLSPQLRKFLEDLEFGVVISTARQDESSQHIYLNLCDMVKGLNSFVSI
jgi:hypothetical protein